MSTTKQNCSFVQPLPPCLRPKDAANFLQIGLSTLWLWAKQGKVPPPVKMGGRCTVWRRADLEAYLGLNNSAEEQGA